MAKSKEGRPNLFYYNFFLVLSVLGFIWARSSYGKLSEGKFVGSLGETLIKFAGKNPYPWFKKFLESTAVPNSQLFGLLTLWGEVFAAVTILGVSIYLLIKPAKNPRMLMLLALGLLTGLFLNLVFWLAAGWMSPSTDGLNLVMAGIELIGLAITVKLLKA